MTTKIEELYKQAHNLISQAKAALEADGELTDQKREEIDRWLSQAEEIEKRAKQMESVLERDLALVEAENRQAVEAQTREKDAKAEKGGFKSFGEYLASIVKFREKHVPDARLTALEEKALAGEQGDLGGFLIQPEHRQDILTARGEASIIRQRARVIPMGSRVVPFPAVDLTQGAAGASAFYGGGVYYWVEENAEITESSVKFREIELHARELAGLISMPNGLIRDSIVSMEVFLAGPGSFGGGLGWSEDYAFLRANGVGKPVGMLNADCKVTVARAGAGAIAYADIIGMYAKMLMGGEPIWIASQSILPQLMAMVDAGNTLVWQPGAVVGKPDTLLGRPIFYTEKLPALGTEGDLMFVDPSYYLVGDRQNITIDWSEHIEFKKNKKVFRILEAVDGQAWLNASITLADGSTSVSPIVVLTDAA